MIRSFLIGVSAAAVMAGSAFAADLGAAPAGMAPILTWSGFYVGANVGYVGGGRLSSIGSTNFVNPGIGQSDVVTDSVRRGISNRGTDLSAILAGGGVGYNWQFGSIVAGVEADIQASSASRQTDTVNSPTIGFAANPTVGSITTSQRFNYIGTVRGRLGYTVFDNLLVYATGGLAYGEKSSSFSFNAATVGSSANPYAFSVNRSKTETGYVVGGGLEYMLDASWSVKAEALYYDLGRTQTASQLNLFSPAGRFGGVGVNTSTDNKGVIGRVGLNYKFNWF